MAGIGKKITDFEGKITSSTFSETGGSVNTENEVGEYGTVLATISFGPAAAGAEDTGTASICGQCFLPDGGTLPFTGSGTWQRLGNHRGSIKLIQLGADGTRTFAASEIALATRSIKGTLYALA